MTNEEKSRKVSGKVEEEPMSRKPKVFVYHQRPDETRDEYWDRVINESLPDWEDRWASF